MAVDIWSYRIDVEDLDLSDFRVEAVDGEIGKVDDATFQPGADVIVVDTGPFLIGRKVMLPIGTIGRIDRDSKTLYVDRTRDEIKDAPEYDPSGYADQEYRLALAGYYTSLYE